MQGWKEETSKLTRWEVKGVPMLYPILFIILLIPILFWNVKNIYFDTFEIDDTSARYLLSALVQSLAAIIAIVVTMTLVAVQLAASAYSPRVIDIFKKDWVMWLLLVWYGLSIFFGLFVLEMIGGKYQSLGHWGVSLESCVFLAYLMGIAAFAGLFFHIGNVIDLLKPENIIKRLAIENSIQSIMDIIHSSVMKYDLETMRVGLKAVTDRMIRIIGLDVQNIVVIDPDEESTEEAIKKIDRRKRPVDTTLDIDPRFFDFFKRVARLTVSKMDEESTREVIENLYNFGRLSSENGLEDVTRRVAESLGFIGKLTAEKGKEFEEVTSRAVQSLIEVGRIASKSELENATEQTAESLGIVGKTVAEKGLEDVTIQAVLALKFVGKTAAESGLEDATSIVLHYLGDVGTAAAEKGLERAASEAAWSIRSVGKTAAEKGLGDATEQATWSLGAIGRIATEKGLEDAKKIVARSLGAVGTIAIEKELKFFVAAEAARFLDELTISSEEIPDHDSPQKFMNLYKQRLEELRTQKPDPSPHK